MAKTRQDIKLTKAIYSMLEDDPILQKFRETKYTALKDKVKHNLRRKKRIDAMVEAYKMLLQGGSFILPGKIVSERCTPLTTYITVDAQTIMSAICGVIDRAPGYTKKRVTPPKKKFTHS